MSGEVLYEAKREGRVVGSTVAYHDPLETREQTDSGDGDTPGRGIVQLGQVAVHIIANTFFRSKNG